MVSTAKIGRLQGKSVWDIIRRFRQIPPTDCQGALCCGTRVWQHHVHSGHLSDNTFILGIVISRGHPDGRAEWITADDVGQVAASSVSDQELRLDDKAIARRILEGLPR